MAVIRPTTIAAMPPWLLARFHPKAARTTMESMEPIIPTMFACIHITPVVIYIVLKIAIIPIMRVVILAILSRAAEE